MEIAGASHGSGVTGVEQLLGTANYFGDQDPAKWRSSIPTYAKVKYAGVYPGIDLVYYGNQRQLEYDFIVAPQADPKPVHLHFVGARKLLLAKNGDLTVATGGGEIAFRKPVVYQMKDGQRQPIEGQFTLLTRNTIGFHLGAYDHTRELVIDPTLAYSTFLGAGANGYMSVALAAYADGSIFVTGNTSSPTFPITPGAYHTVPNQAFVTRLNSAGSALIYSTFLGGSPNAIAVDHAENVYIAGAARTGQVATTAGAFQSVSNCIHCLNGFVTKLNPTGSALVYSTFLGGSGYHSSGDVISAIAVDRSGSAYLTGFISSFDFPVTDGAFQPRNRTRQGSYLGTAFVTKLNPAGTRLVYSTYLGGDGGTSDDLADSGSAIAVDDAGYAYVGGFTTSLDFPVWPNSYQRVKHRPITGDPYSGFITKINRNGTSLIYSTFLGGSGNSYGDVVSGIAVDSSGNAYVTGYTGSFDFPTTPGVFQTAIPLPADDADGDAYSGFVTKLNATGSDLVYSTFLGGTTSDSGSAIALDDSGDAVIAGTSYSADFPVTADAFQSINNTWATEGRYGFGATNSVLTKLNSTGSALIYSTYLGGSGAGNDGDVGSSVALDSLGNVYLGGTSSSFDFPVTSGAFQQQNPSASIYAPFVAKFAFHGATTTTITANENPQAAGGSVTFTALVSSVGGGATPTGVASFNVDGKVAAHVDLDGSGYASFTSVNLAAGAHRIIASYLGDSANYSASSESLTQVITGTVATPTFLPLGGTFESSPTMVAIATTTPGATIYYTTNNALPSTASTKYSGPIAVSSTETVKAIAIESDDTSSTVSSATYTLVPAAIATSTSLQSSGSPSALGIPVTFTATVTSASGPAPTGSVTFKHGGVVMGTGTLSGGTASFTTSALTPLGHDITATYTGSATDAESTSPVLRQYVNP